VALVTSEWTVWLCATAPRVASAGPSIAGWVFQVTVPSFHAQSVIAWRRPPVTLWALVTFATCSRTWALVTWRAPTPLTLTRRRVRCTPVVPGFAATPLSTARRGLAPKVGVGRAGWAEGSGGAAATGGLGGENGGGPPAHT